MKSCLPGSLARVYLLLVVTASAVFTTGLLCSMLLWSPPVRAACNPATVENCCTNVTSNACEWVSYAGASGVTASGGCSRVVFDLEGVYDATNEVTTWSWWYSLDPAFTDCPTNTVETITDAVAPSIEWTITSEDGTIIGQGGGTHAEAEVEVYGDYTGTFDVITPEQPDGCERYTASYEATTNCVIVSLTVPDFVGINDLVMPCSDTCNFVTTAAEYDNDADDLQPFEWSVAPEDRGDVTISGADGVRVLMRNEPEVIESPSFSPTTPDLSLRLEGIDASEVPGEAKVTLSYAGCTAVATTTVVSVKLDRDSYDRMEPFPEVRIEEPGDSDGVVVTGQTVTVRYRAKADVLGPDTGTLEREFVVPGNLGTYEWRVEYTNRLRFIGSDVIRVTVYSGPLGLDRKVRVVNVDQTDPAIAAPPPSAVMSIAMQDAVCETGPEAYANLSPPLISGLPGIQEARPIFTVTNVRLFAETAHGDFHQQEDRRETGPAEPPYAYRDLTRACAAFMKIVGPGVVGVNDRWPEDDPGDDVSEHERADDPDLVNEAIEGLPACIKAGRVKWSTDSDKIRLVRRTEEERAEWGAEVVCELPGSTDILLEGRQPSEAVRDVEVLATVEIDDDPANPLGFRGKTLEVRRSFTVAQLDWRRHTPDGSAIGDEHGDARVCDKDLRPRVVVNIPAAGSSPLPDGPCHVEGRIGSMLDVVQLIWVNGEAVAATNIFFDGVRLTEMDEVIKRLGDKPPPHVVTFRHTLSRIGDYGIRVEAANRAYGGDCDRGVFDLQWAVSAGMRELQIRRQVPDWDLDGTPMVRFFDEDDPGPFLYKTHVAHMGRTASKIDVHGDCPAQPGEEGAYQRYLPLVFVSKLMGAGIASRGIDVEEASEGSSPAGINAIYQDLANPIEQVLTPIDLDMLGPSEGTVPDAWEWFSGCYADADADGVELRLTAAQGQPGWRMRLFDKAGHLETTWTIGEAKGSRTVTHNCKPWTDTGTYELSAELSDEDGELRGFDRMRLTTVRVDVDVDSDNNNGLALPDRSTEEDDIEEEAPGKILLLNDGYTDHDVVQDWADGFDLDGQQDNEDDVCDATLFAPLVVEIPTCLDLQQVRLKINYDDSDPAQTAKEITPEGQVWNPAPGALRIWRRPSDEARSGDSANTGIYPGGDWVQAGTYDDIRRLQPNVWDSESESESGQPVYVFPLYIEAVRKGPSSITVSLDPDGDGPAGFVVSDTVMITAVARPDLDADSDNTWHDVSLPSKPDETPAEEKVERDAPGVAVGLADDDVDNNGTDDCDETTLSQDGISEEAFNARLAKMAKLKLTLPALMGGISCRIGYDAEYIRLWYANDSGSYDAIEDQHEFGEDDGSPIELLVEGLRAPKEPEDPFVTADVSYSSGEQSDEPVYSTKLRVCVVPTPFIEDFSPEFTPRQVEAPPCHLGLFDYALPKWDDSILGGGTTFDIGLLVRNRDSEDWTSLFYRGRGPYDGEATASAPVFGLTNRTDVASLYDLGNTPKPEGYSVLERIGWDGRKDADDDGQIDKDENDDETKRKQVWADQPPTIAGSVFYEWRLATLVNKRPLARMIRYRTLGDGSQDVVTQRVNTISLPLEARGETTGPVNGRPVYWGFFRDVVDSLHVCPALAENLARVRDGVGPLPDLTLYYAGNNWRHSVFGYGWSSSLDMRVLDARVDGQRKLYLMRPDGLADGPADENGHIWVDGERGVLADVADGYAFTNRNRTVYGFDRSGQVKSVKDRNENEMSIALQAYPGVVDDVFVKRPGSVSSACGVTMAAEYDDGEDEAGTHVRSMSLGGRQYTFQYEQAEKRYAEPYPADGVLKQIEGPGLKLVYEWEDGRTANRASRIISGGLKTRTLTDTTEGRPSAGEQVPFAWRFDYSTPEDVETLMSEAVVSGLRADDGGVWMQTTISDGRATLGDGTSVQHGYDGAGHLQAVTFSKSGESATVRTTYDSQGRLLTYTAGSLDATYAYKLDQAPDDDGALASETRAGYAATEYDYDGNLRVLSSVRYPDGREVVYSDFDGHGNHRRITESGSGLTREWSVERGAGGRIAAVTLPGGGVTRVVYSYDGGGRLIGVARGQQTLFSRTYDSFGNLTSSTDADGRTDGYGYDERDRRIRWSPPGDLERWGYDAFGRALFHVAPKGTAEAPAETVFHLDGYGRIESSTTTGGDGHGAGLTLETSYQELDGEGHPAKVSMDGGKLVIDYTYDWSGQIASEKRGGHTVGEWTYDAAGLLTKEVNAYGGTYQYEYDSLGRFASVTPPQGYGSLTVTYGQDGLAATRVDDGGNGSQTVTTRYTYDGLSRLRTASDPRGFGDWTYNYDLRDNLLSVQRPDGESETYQVDLSRDLPTSVSLPGVGDVSLSCKDSGYVESFALPGNRTYSFPQDAFGGVGGISAPGKAPVTLETSVYGVSGVVAGERSARASRVDSLQRMTAFTSSGSDGEVTTRHEANGPVGVTDRSGLSAAIQRKSDGSAQQVTVAGVTTDVTGKPGVGLISATTPENQYLTATVALEYTPTGMRKKETVSGGGGTAENEYTVDGHDLVNAVTIKDVGSIEVTRDAGLLPASVSVFGRVYQYERNARGDATSVTLPGNRVITQTRDAAGRLLSRHSPGGIDETFTRDPVTRFVSAHTVEGTTIDLEWTQAGEIASLVNDDATTRSIQRNSHGEITSDSIGGSGCGYGYDAAGRLTATSAGGGSSWTLEYDAEGRLRKTTCGDTVLSWQFDAAKNPASLSIGYVPSCVLTYDSTFSGDAWSTAVAQSGPFARLTQPVTGASVLSGAGIAGGTAGASAEISLSGGLLPTLYTRTGDNAFNTQVTRDGHNDITHINHASLLGIALTRRPEIGWIDRAVYDADGSMHDRDVAYQRNDAGWIVHEDDGRHVIDYLYRGDGVRTGYVLNGRRCDQDVTSAGRVKAQRNATLGPKAQAPEPAFTRVTLGRVAFTNALAEAYAIYGAGPFTAPFVVRVDAWGLDEDPLEVDAADWALQPTAENPLIVRGGRGGTLLPAVTVRDVPHVRLERLVSDGPVLVTNSSGAAVCDTIVRTEPVTVWDCPSATVSGCSFAFTDGSSRLLVTNSVGASVEGCLFLNKEGWAGVEFEAGIAHQCNAWWPTAAPWPEPTAVHADPHVSSTSLRVLDGSSPLMAAWSNSVWRAGDIDGLRRHVEVATIGASEAVRETTLADAAGRVTRRTVSGIDYDYAYDGFGRLVAYTDHGTPANNASYAYDWSGRRIRRQVHDAVTRYVYAGDDVLAEFHDDNGDGDYADNDDYRRAYWLLATIDQRLGYIEQRGGTESAYAVHHYLTDANGSVCGLAVGWENVFFAYDAFGNLLPGADPAAFSADPYRFHGREYDPERGDYYYRARIYVPEWGCFTGPDMNLAAGPENEPFGMMSYVFCGNDPTRYDDPLGLSCKTELAQRLGKESADDAIEKLARRLARSGARGMFQRHHILMKRLWSDPQIGQKLTELGIVRDGTANIVTLPTRRMKRIAAEGGLSDVLSAAGHEGGHTRAAYEYVEKRLTSILAAEASDDAKRLAIGDLQQQVRQELTSGALRLQNWDKESIASFAAVIGMTGMSQAETEDVMAGQIRTMIEGAGDDNALVRAADYVRAGHYTGKEGFVGFVGQAIDTFNPADDLVFIGKSMAQADMAIGMAVDDYFGRLGDIGHGYAPPDVLNGNSPLFGPASRNRRMLRQSMELLDESLGYADRMRIMEDMSRNARGEPLGP